MGKVRTISPEEIEAKEQQKAQKEAERLARIAEAKEKGRAAKSPVTEPGAEEGIKQTQSTEALAKVESEITESEKKKDSGVLHADALSPQNDEVKLEEKKTKKTSKYAAKQKGKKNQRSENYLTAAKLIDKSKLYTTKEALSLLEKTHLAKFDESVELHINTQASGLSGEVTLPHGTGKSVRVAVLSPSKDAAGTENLLREIESGKISFDVLIATPDAMPKLARVAKVLGPRGLMPNPKAGTVTTNPEAVAKQYEGGQMHFKTEAKMPVMHVVVGKLSFGESKLAENIQAFLKAVKMENIKKVTLKSTMSPAVKLQIGK